MTTTGAPSTPSASRLSSSLLRVRREPSWQMCSAPCGSAADAARIELASRARRSSRADLPACIAHPLRGTLAPLQARRRPRRRCDNASPYCSLSTTRLRSGRGSLARSHTLARCVEQHKYYVLTEQQKHRERNRPRPSRARTRTRTRRRKRAEMGGVNVFATEAYYVNANYQQRVQNSINKVWVDEATRAALHAMESIGSAFWIDTIAVDQRCPRRTHTGKCLQRCSIRPLPR